jgi:hypothetical protein
MAFISLPYFLDNVGDHRSYVTGSIHGEVFPAYWLHRGRHSTVDGKIGG